MYKLLLPLLLLTGPAVLSQPRLHQRLDSLARSYPAAAPGFAFSIEKNGAILYRMAVGVADIATNTPLDSASNFRMASVTKQFTAMGIFLLEKEGRLSFDDAIGRWLPEMPSYVGRQVLIRHLLTHTSGLLDYEALIPDSQTRQVLDADVPRLLAAYDTTYFPPGARFRYSNSGFCLLALIIEKVSHQSFAAFVRERIFLPLHMDHSVVYEEGRSIDHRAMGFARDSTGHIYPSDQSVTSATKGDGGVYTSVADYSRWMRALQENKLLKLAPVLRRLRAPIPSSMAGSSSGTRSPSGSTGMAEYYYAGGWFMTGTSPLILFHSGSTSGFANFVIQLPGDEWTIFYFSNEAGNVTPFRKIVRILQEEGVADLSAVFALHDLTR